MRTFNLLLAAFVLSMLPGLVLASDTPASNANQWTQVDTQSAGAREMHCVVYVPSLKRVLLLGGQLHSGDYVMSFDAAAGRWESYTKARPEKLGKSVPAYAVSDSAGRYVYAMVGRQLHQFDVAAKTWSALGPRSTAQFASWSLAYDPVGQALIVLGAESSLDKVGWMGGEVFSLTNKTWTPLVFGDAAARAAHAKRCEALRALEELVGALRHAWYRDPQGAGSEAERADLLAKCAALKKLPGASEWAAQVDELVAPVQGKQLLAALQAAKALRVQAEQAAEAASPTPPARRHAPVVCDPVNKVLLLFGGDHDDCTLNDTWLLDLTTRQWRRAKPAAAPAPRAGHGLVYLPKRKAFALWDGFQHNSSTAYRSFQATLLSQREVWVFDAAADTWTLHASWPRSEKGLPVRTGHRNMGFFGYHSQPFPMALASDAEDRLIFVGKGPEKSGKVHLNGTSVLTVLGDGSAPKESVAPNSRAERTGPFLAAHCEVPDVPKPTGIENLPANTWTLLPSPPRKPYTGWRKLDYGTAAWNPDADEILHWGGGHCDSSSSAVIHWSLNANRMVQSYDLDEPYSSNGGGPGGKSLLGRPWVPTHAYRSYAYDYKHKLMVLLISGVGKSSRLYDPVGMRWLTETHAQPFNGHCYTAHLIATPHGVVAWAGTRNHMGTGGRGLWLFDRTSGWKELTKQGSAPACRVDCSCSAYDSKRDRVLLFPGDKEGPNVFAVGVKDGAVQKLTPTHPGLGKIWRKEATYIEHCDWTMLVQTSKHGEKVGHVVYDCAKNRWMLFDAGPLTSKMPSPGRGMVYDAKRKLVYLITEDGKVYGLRIDPATAQLVTAE